MKQVMKDRPSVTFIGRIVKSGGLGRLAVFIPKEVVETGIPRTKHVKVRIEEITGVE